MGKDNFVRGVCPACKGRKQFVMKDLSGRVMREITCTICNGEGFVDMLQSKPYPDKKYREGEKQDGK